MTLNDFFSVTPREQQKDPKIILALKYYYDLNRSLIAVKEGTKIPLSHDILSEKGILSHNGNYAWKLGEYDLVIDIDIKSGKLGLDSYKKLLNNIGYSKSIIYTQNITTPSGGYHFYFKLPKSNNRNIKKNDCRYPDIDFLGLGDICAIGGNIIKIEHELKQYVFHNGNVQNEDLTNKLMIHLWKSDTSIPHHIENRDNCDHITNDESNIAINNKPHFKEDQIIELLYQIDNSNYDTWLKVGMCLHSWDYKKGLDWFIKWSRTSDKFNKDDLLVKWKSFEEKPHNLTCRSLYNFVENNIISYDLDKWADIDIDGEPLVDPYIFENNSITLLCGSPKSGKTLLIFNMLAHFACGLEFLGFNPSRKLKSYIVQGENSKRKVKSLASKIKSILPTEENRRDIAANVIATAPFTYDLSKLSNIISLADIILLNKPDIIVIDTLSQFNYKSNHNDNNEMLNFFESRIKLLSKMLGASSILILHHLHKKPTLGADFDSIRGAGSMIGYAHTNMKLDRIDNNSYLYYSGKDTSGEVAFKYQDNKVIEIHPSTGRLINKVYGAKLDAERIRKYEIILKLLQDKAAFDEKYTIGMFKDKFCGFDGLGSNTSIQNYIKQLIAKNYIRFKLENKFKPKDGILVCREMVDSSGNVISPTHYLEEYSSDAVFIQVSEDSLWGDTKSFD